MILAVSTFRLKRAMAAKFLEVCGGLRLEYREMVGEMCSGLAVALEV